LKCLVLRVANSAQAQAWKPNSFFRRFAESGR
jgi:hypothetical protein